MSTRLFLALKVAEQYKRVTEQYGQLAQQTQTLAAENSELKQQISTPDTSLTNRQPLVVAHQESLDIDTPNTSLSGPLLQSTVPGGRLALQFHFQLQATFEVLKACLCSEGMFSR